MKAKLIITICFFTSYLLTAQISDNTLGEAKPDDSVTKFGNFVMEMPFGAKLYNANNLKAQELLDNIKSICKGKAIYIDFWAIWCSPCIEEMPKSKTFYFQAKNLPLEFIYICTNNGTSIDNWITKISYLKQPGIHIYADDNIIQEMWGLLPTGGGFPTHIFIDTNGEFKPGAIPLNSGTTFERLSGLIKK